MGNYQAQAVIWVKDMWGCHSGIPILAPDIPQTPLLNSASPHRALHLHVPEALPDFPWGFWSRQTRWTPGCFLAYRATAVPGHCLGFHRTFLNIAPHLPCCCSQIPSCRIHPQNGVPSGNAPWAWTLRRRRSSAGTCPRRRARRYR